MYLLGAHLSNLPQLLEQVVPTKQHSTMSSSKEPIVFKSPGLKPDVRLTVFDQEFHVHSTLLKLYSAFFRTYLDSADKAPAPSSAVFRYEYVSVIDEDGTWGLEAASKVRTFSNPPLSFNSF